MAQIAHPTDLQPDIDYHLDYQFQAWESVPEYAEWWPDMDVTQREVFHLEWVGITESRLAGLRRWAEQGLLTAAQRARYGNLMKLIARHRPIVEEMLRC